MAILWQDDGGIYEEDGYLHGVLSLNLVSILDATLFIDWIFGLTKALGTVRLDHNGRFSIRFSLSELSKLVPCIEQYVIPELAYKVCLDASKRRLASLPKFVLEDDKIARAPELLDKFFEEYDLVRPTSMVKM